MNLKRHGLVKISRLGREISFQWVRETIFEEERLKQIHQLMVDGYHETTIPAIIRRKEETHHKNVLAVGFSSPFLLDGSRLRVPAFVPLEEIEAIATPYDILSRDFFERTKALKLLKEVKDLAELHDINLGIWGSASLEVLTGLHYTHEDSDLDLIMKSKDLDKIKFFYDAIKELGVKYKTKVDVELELEGFDIRIAELFTKTDTILGKGIDSVDLYPREEILTMIG